MIVYFKQNDRLVFEFKDSLDKKSGNIVAGYKMCWRKVSDINDESRHQHQDLVTIIKYQSSTCRNKLRAEIGHQYNVADIDIL